MTNTTVTRRDPMKEVMPYELLEVAHSLLVNKQNKAYWDNEPTPKRPLGVVRFEVARQIGTFAVPLFGLALAYMAWGSKGLLFGLPVAWALGYLLDKQLAAAVYKQWLRDVKLDSGRYNAVKWLAEQMGVAREEITLPVIYKMAEDFRTVDSARRAEAARAEAARAAAMRGSRRRVRAGEAGAAAAATAGGAAQAASVTYEDYDSPVPEIQFPTVNPANGLPMLPGNAIDIQGNPFGTDHTGF